MNTDHCWIKLDSSDMVGVREGLNVFVNSKDWTAVSVITYLYNELNVFSIWIQNIALSSRGWYQINTCSRGISASFQFVIILTLPLFRTWPLPMWCQYRKYRQKALITAIQWWDPIFTWPKFKIRGLLEKYPTFFFLFFFILFYFIFYLFIYFFFFFLFKNLVDFTEVRLHDATLKIHTLDSYLSTRQA